MEPWTIGWIFYALGCLFALIFSLLYVFWYRKSEDGTTESFVGALICGVSLFTALIASILVPVDILVVSSMKFNNGTFQPWAEKRGDRDWVRERILLGYYVLYSFVCFFLFTVLPFSFFFFKSPRETPLRDRLCRAIKFTLLTCTIFLLFLVTGYFIPFQREPQGLINVLTPFTDSSEGESIPVFLLNLLNLIGTLFLVLYTGFGLSSLPCGMIQKKGSILVRRECLESQLDIIQEQIDDIKSRFGEDLIPYNEQLNLDRLEQQARLLRRSHFILEQKARSCVNRFFTILRPFEMIFGIFFTVCSFFIVLSLILSSVDRALHSDGAASGYALKNQTLPNPMDTLLSWSESLFPLDFITYIGIILLFLFSSASGIKNIGIRLFCLPVYEVKARKTCTQGLVLVSASLMYIILALNAFMYSIVPNYTTFGNQNFILNDTNYNYTHLHSCGSRYPGYEKNCLSTQISLLLSAYHDTLWIFDALYFWLHLAFIVVVLIGSIVAVYIKRASYYRSGPERQGDEEILFDNNDEG